MKLVIGGASGYVGTELVRQALSNPEITSVVALSRRPTPLPEGLPEVQEAKFIPVICDDFAHYGDNVKQALQDADACIWTIAVTPTKSQGLQWEDIVKISRDYAVTAIETMSALSRTSARSRPFRFVYMSGHFAQRDRDAPVPDFVKNNGMLEMVLMRGEAEKTILGYAEQSGGTVEACVIKPGFIAGPGRDAPPPNPHLPSVQLDQVTTVLLDQVLHGFEKDTLLNNDMVRIAEEIAKKSAA